MLLLSMKVDYYCMNSLYVYSFDYMFLKFVLLICIDVFGKNVFLNFF